MSMFEPRLAGSGIVRPAFHMIGADGFEGCRGEDGLQDNPCVLVTRVDGIGYVAARY